MTAANPARPHSPNGDGLSSPGAADANFFQPLPSDSGRHPCSQALLAELRDAILRPRGSSSTAGEEEEDDDEELFAEIQGIMLRHAQRPQETRPADQPPTAFPPPRDKTPAATSGSAAIARHHPTSPVVHQSIAWAAILAEVRARAAQRFFDQVVVALEGRPSSLRTIQDIVEVQPGVMAIKTCGGDDDDDDDDGWTLLHKAAYRSAPKDVLEYFIGLRPQLLQERSARGFLPLHVAADSGSIETVVALTEAFPEALLAKSRDGSTPLFLAVFAFRLERRYKVSLYLAAAEPIALKEANNKGMLPLHGAVVRYFRPVSVVRILAMLYPEALQVRTKCGSLPLHAASRWGGLDVVQFLHKEYPEALEARNLKGEIPLHLAARFACVEVAQYLLRADLNSTTLQATTSDLLRPLHFAACSLRPEVIEFFVARDPAGLRERTNDGSLPIHFAAGHNRNGARVQFLVDNHPAGLQAKNKAGFLPLHCAALHNNSVRVVQCLIDSHPAGLQAKTNDGSLPIHLAVRENLVQVAKLYVDNYPAGLHSKMNDGSLAMHVAARRSFAPMVTLLIDLHPVGLQATTNDESLALHCAAYRGKPEIVRLLAEAYPQALQTKNKEGFLPLHVAAQSSINVRDRDKNECQRTVQLLVDLHPAGLQATTNGGSLALHCAADGGDPEIVRLLAEAYPPALQTKNKEGFLPLHVAAQSSSKANDGDDNDRLVVINYLARSWPEAIAGAASWIRRPAPQP